MAARLIVCVAIVLLGLAQVGNAWWRKEHTIRKQTDITEDCLDKLNAGECDFYTHCLERRFPCHAKGFALRYGYDYCTKLVSNHDRFDAEGKNWSGDVRKCLVSGLRGVYEVDRQKCSHIKKSGMGVIADCFKKTEFCEIVRENKAVLWDIFKIRDLSTIRLWRELLKILGHCAKGGIKDVIGWIGRKISPFHG